MQLLPEMNFEVNKYGLEPNIEVMSTIYPPVVLQFVPVKGTAVPLQVDEAAQVSAVTTADTNIEGTTGHLQLPELVS